MHKKIYALGFLFHPRTAQILLQQKNSNDPNATWSLLGGLSSPGETPAATFKRILNSDLEITVPLRAISEVYDYIDSESGETKHVCYVLVKSLKGVKTEKGTTNFSWFTLKEISKLKISPLEKQDIIVGQRVIDSASRKSSGEQTID